MFRLKKTSVPALMLAAVLLFATAAGAEEADPAAVRVGEVVYPPFRCLVCGGSLCGYCGGQR